VIISIWRFSHLALAVTSSVFILILSVTGAILAFDPIDAKLEPHISIDDFPDQSLAQIITTTRDKYNEVLGLSVDANGFLSISTIDEVGGIADFYIHPRTAEKTGEISLNQIRHKPPSLSLLKRNRTFFSRI
jgi:sulfite reductase (NADPH) flavoprotein alpha-component